MDGLSVGWRCTYDGHISRCHQRELESPRYRCSGQGKGIHVDLELSELLFCCYTKFLLLIDDKQAQVFKFQVFADQSVGTDQYIDLPFGQVLNCFFLCIARIQAHKLYVRGLKVRLHLLFFSIFKFALLNRSLFKCMDYKECLMKILINFILMMIFGELL